MKKRYLALLLVVALLVCAAVLTVGAEEPTAPVMPTHLASDLTATATEGVMTGYCPHCELKYGKEAYEADMNSTTEWTALTFTTGHQDISAEGHYYVADDLTKAGALRGDAGVAGADVVIHLNGKTVTRAHGTKTYVYGIIAHRSTPVGVKYHIVGNTGENPGTFEADGNVISDTYDSGTNYFKYSNTKEMHVTLYSGNIRSNLATAADNRAVVRMANANSSFTMYGGTISGGYATQGGAILAKAGAEVNIHGGTIQDCHASDRAGGIYVTGSGTTLNMTGGTIQNCYIDEDTTGSDFGGNIYVESSASAHISGTAQILNGNVPSDPEIVGSTKTYGGNISCRSGTTLNISGNAVIKDGQASRGDNIYVTGGTASSPSVFSMSGGTITATPVEEGTTNTGNGAAVYLDKAVSSRADTFATFNMTGGTIENITTDGNGMIATITNCTGEGSAINISGGTIQNCQAENGGAIYLTEPIPVTITGGTISNCQAVNGGAIYMDVEPTDGENNVTITGGTISECIAEGVTTQSTATTGETLWQYTITEGEGEEATPVTKEVAYDGTNYFLYANDAIDTATDLTDEVAGLEPGALKPITETSDAYGGAIYVASGTLEIGAGEKEGVPTVGKITSCNARTRGGAVSVHGTASTLKLTGGEIRGNAEATSRPTYGGNVYIENGTFTMTAGGIYDGTAYTGGNLCIGGSSGNATVSGGTIAGGHAENLGGNVAILNKSATFTLSGTGALLASASEAGAEPAYRAASANYGDNIGYANGQSFLNGGTVGKGTTNSSICLSNNANAQLTVGAVTLDPADRIKLRNSEGELPKALVTIGAYEGTLLLDWSEKAKDAFAFNGGDILPRAAADTESDTSKAAVFVYDDTGSKRPCYISEANVVLAAVTGYRIDEETGESVEEAVTGIGAEGYAYYKLHRCADGYEHPMTADAIVDLNNQVTTINNDDFMLYPVDYRTNTVTKADSEYDSKLTVTNHENVVLFTQNPIDNRQYMVLGHAEDGTVITDGTTPSYYTANRIGIEFREVSVRPAKNGVYYTTRVVAHPRVAQFVEQYGVALTLGEMPDADFVYQADVLYTEITEKPETAYYNVTTRSALLSNILRDDLSAADDGDVLGNNSRGQLEVKSNAYIKLTNLPEGYAEAYRTLKGLSAASDIYIMADESCAYSMLKIMQTVNGIEGLNSDTRVVDFYNKWRTLADGDCMFGWDGLDQIEAAWQSKCNASTEA